MEMERGTRRAFHLDFFQVPCEPFPLSFSHESKLRASKTCRASPSEDRMEAERESHFRETSKVGTWWL